MDIKCPSCLGIFQPCKSEEERINRAVARGQKLLMTDCSICYNSIPVVPTGLMAATKETKSEVAIKCPICGDGIVSYIDDESEKFWGCGECGNIWNSKEDLDKAISTL